MFNYRTSSRSRAVCRRALTDFNTFVDSLSVLIVRCKRCFCVCVCVLNNNVQTERFYLHNIPTNGSDDEPKKPKTASNPGISNGELVRRTETGNTQLFIQLLHTIGPVDNLKRRNSNVDIMSAIVGDG